MSHASQFSRVGRWASGLSPRLAELLPPPGACSVLEQESRPVGVEVRREDTPAVACCRVGGAHLSTPCLAACPPGPARPITGRGGVNAELWGSLLCTVAQ